MLKVLLMAPYASIHTKRWVASLRERGLNVLVVTAEGGDSEKKEPNVFVLPFLFRVFPKHMRFIFLGLYAKGINLFFRADIIHAYYLSSYGIAVALFFKKYLVSVWGSDINLSLFGSFQTRLLRFSLKKADFVFVTSKFLLNEVKKNRNERALVIPFGIDTEKFKPQNNTNKKFFNIGCTKWLSDIYGISFLIEVLHTLVNSYDYQNIRLYLTGDGERDCRFKAKVEELNLDGNVIFMGAVEPQKMPEVYSLLDLACFPSKRDSFGVSVLEASASGLPVLTSNVEGLKEVVLDGVTGNQLDVDDSEGFVKQIIFHINNPEDSKLMGLAGRNFVLDKYSWKSSVDQMIESYNELK